MSLPGSMSRERSVLPSALPGALAGPSEAVAGGHLLSPGAGQTQPAGSSGVQGWTHAPRTAAGEQASSLRPSAGAGRPPGGASAVRPSPRLPRCWSDFSAAAEATASLTHRPSLGPHEDPGGGRHAILPESAAAGRGEPGRDRTRVQAEPCGPGVHSRPHGPAPESHVLPATVRLDVGKCHEADLTRQATSARRRWRPRPHPALSGPRSHRPPHHAVGAKLAEATLHRGARQTPAPPDEAARFHAEPPAAEDSPSLPGRPLLPLLTLFQDKGNQGMSFFGLPLAGDTSCKGSCPAPGPACPRLFLQSLLGPSPCLKRMGHAPSAQDVGD